MPFESTANLGPKALSRIAPTRIAPSAAESSAAFVPGLMLPGCMPFCVGIVESVTVAAGGPAVVST